MNIREAAEARAAGVRARADRPSQRRSSEAPGSAARVSVRLAGLEIRQVAAGGPFAFDGYASVTNQGYEMYDAFGPFTEVMSSGAFANTLSRSDLDVPLVLQHEDLRRVARTTNGTLHLSEDENGLRVRADLDPDDQDVQYILPKLRSGLIDEMSFKFRINAGQWSDDWSEYHVSDVDFHRGDVAIVGYGANPHTKGSGLATPDTESILAAFPKENREQVRALLAPPKTGIRVRIDDSDVTLRALPL
jgi:HK97 family phage prohead protease